MPTDRESRLGPLLDRLALFLAVLGVVLRCTLCGATAGTGTNLLLHLLFWIALAFWFARRALENGAAYRFTGFEFAFLAFAIASLVSVLRSSYRLPALEHAIAHLSYALLFVLIVNALGARALLSLLLPTLVALSVYALLQVLFLFPKIDASRFSTEFQWRLKSNEAFASFLGPNQFAGFLALLLPVLAGYARDARVRWPAAAALGLGLVAIGLTGSLGGWVALAAGAAAFAALALTRTRGRKAVLLAGGAAAALGLLLLLATPLLEKAAGKNHSLYVRRVYWQAAAKVIAQAPIAGVGLDNFREHYFQVKSDVPQEAMHAHNDYLQVWAETGAIGLLAFLALLAFGLRQALSREALPPAATTDPPGWLVPAAATTAFAGMILLTVHDADAFVTWLVVGAAWLGFHLLMRRAAPAEGLPWTRLGAAAGLVALLVHMTVDFDFYEFGLAMTLVLALALVALLRGKAAELRLPRPVCAAAAATLALVAVPLLLWATPRALAADQELEETRQGARNAVELTLAAQRHNPFDAEAYELHARARMGVWARGKAEGSTAEGIVLQSMENAIALRPLSSPLHAKKATFHREFRKYYLGLKGAMMAEGMAREHLRLALLHQQRAVDLYPTHAPIRYGLARLLDDDGRPAEALEHYREALRLNDLAAKERYPLKRLQLDPVGRARCLVRLGRQREAVDALRERPLAPGEVEEEMDDLMRSVLREAVDGILKPKSP